MTASTHASPSSGSPSRLSPSMGRRDVLRAGLGSLVLGGAQGLGLAPLFTTAAAAASANLNRILVVVELSGGNDGLNTIVPYGDDAYYRARPRIGIKPQSLRKLDDHFGMQNTMSGFERLYRNGQMAIIHGVGYPQPSFSHFSSMAYWQTAAPNRGSSYGWMGALADVLDPDQQRNYIVNIDTNQSLAIASRNHVPLVFDDPAQFSRALFADQLPVLDPVLKRDVKGTMVNQFMNEITQSAIYSQQLVRPGVVSKRPLIMGLCALAWIRLPLSSMRNSPRGYFISLIGIMPLTLMSIRPICMLVCGLIPPITLPLLWPIWRAWAAPRMWCYSPLANLVAEFRRIPARAQITARLGQSL